MNSLTLPATLDSLEDLACFLQEAAQKATLDTKAAYRLQLAVDEVVTNIIVHGYQAAGVEGSIDLQAEIDDHALTIIVEDSAAEFDPTKHKAPVDLTAALEDRNIGGLGVYLALKAVDRFSYQRVGNRNRNQFVILRGQSQNAGLS